MSTGSPQPAAFDAALAGDKLALGRLLNRYRNLLLALANKRLDENLRAKCGASDLVQETLLLAYRGFTNFRGRTEAELLAWLRETLCNELADVHRRYLFTAKRNATEVSLTGKKSAEGPNYDLPDPSPTPASEDIRREDNQRIVERLTRLPPAFREVVLLRCHEGLSFAEVGHRMGRSENAAQKLWVKAIRQLQADLGIRS